MRTFLLLLVAMFGDASFAAPSSSPSDSSGHGSYSAARGINGWMGGVNGYTTMLLVVDPVREFSKVNVRSAIFASTGGGFIGAVGWKLSKLGLDRAGEEYFRQDGAASASLLMGAWSAGATTDLGLGEFVAWGWGLQGGGLLVQRAVMEHWGQDSSRLAMLGSLQYGGAVASMLMLSDVYAEEGSRNTKVGLLPLLLWSAPYLVARRLPKVWHRGRSPRWGGAWAR